MSLTLRQSSSAAPVSTRKRCYGIAFAGIFVVAVIVAVVISATQLKSSTSNNNNNSPAQAVAPSLSSPAPAAPTAIVQPSTTTGGLGAAVTVQLNGLAMKLTPNDTAATFLSTCSNFFASQLPTTTTTPTTSNLTNVNCSHIVSQQVVVPGQRRRRQQQQQKRALQTYALQVTVQVVEYDAVASITSAVSSSSLSPVVGLTTAVLEATVNASSALWVHLLSAYPALASVTQIVAIKSPTQLCNGLANLCDLPVNTILFATVHNSAAAAANGFNVAPNQNGSLEDALAAGYRGINMDIGKCNGVIQLVHGFCFLGTRDLVETYTNIVNFLQANPNEVIIMTIQIDYTTGGNVTLNEIDAVMQQVTNLKAFMYDHSNATASWPTLRELIAANTRLLFFTYDGERCYGPGAVTCPTGFMDWFEYAGESQFIFNNVAAVGDNANSCVITRGGGLPDFYGVNVFLLIPSTTASVVLNSQAFLASHIEACSNITGRPANLVFVDFWDIGDALAVVLQHNQGL